MTLAEIVDMLSADVLCCKDELDTEIHSACGSDMMSDVLAYVKEQGLLLTGLVNAQVVRTADMMDIRGIVFVRNKKPDEEMISLAEKLNIVLMSSPLRMFEACGLLYANGLNK